MMVNHRYVFLGPQGSGKGTQAEMLAVKLGVPHLSTGELFRQAVSDETALGQHIASTLAAGSLVPDEATNELIAEWLKTAAASAGFILDGYPRNLIQAEFLDHLTDIDRAVLLELPDDGAVQRLTARFQCPRCGRMYNAVSQPPHVPGVCDACETALVRRDDDTEEAIRERLKLYHQETEPLINFYEEKQLLLRIDARPAVPEVFAAICRGLRL